MKITLGTLFTLISIYLSIFGKYIYLVNIYISLYLYVYTHIHAHKHMTSNTFGFVRIL